MSKMFNPPHPGEVLQELWLEPAGITMVAAAPATIATWREHTAAP